MVHFFHLFNLQFRGTWSQYDLYPPTDASQAPIKIKITFPAVIFTVPSITESGCESRARNTVRRPALAASGGERRGGLSGGGRPAEPPRCPSSWSGGPIQPPSSPSRSCLKPFPSLAFYALCPFFEVYIKPTILPFFVFYNFFL